MKNKTSEARKQRRLYEMFLKKYKPAQYLEWKAGASERGNKIHTENTEAVRKTEEAMYEAIQTRMIQRMKSEGKSDSDIDVFIEDWVKGLKLWGSSERPMRLREIKRERNLI